MFLIKWKHTRKHKFVHINAHTYGNCHITLCIVGTYKAEQTNSKGLSIMAQGVLSSANLWYS